MGRMKESAKNGQQVCTDTAPDRSSHIGDTRQAAMGASMAGGDQDISHSLSGGGRAVSYNDTPVPSDKRMNRTSGVASTGSYGGSGPGAKERYYGIGGRPGKPAGGGKRY